MMISPESIPPRTQRSKLRDTAIGVVKALTESGHVAYFAGGCVRDRLMGFEPADYDVATDARPEQVADIFHHSQAVGESFGVMLVRQGQHVIQVATFRTDGVYSDGRHPDSVTFSDAEHDARRRDFTINGLFEDPLNDRIIDFVGGRNDLETHVIRAIGDPHSRLREDRLRMLRAVRFAARFGFAIEPGTADAIRLGASELEGVSRERIGQEVKKMLSHPNRAVAAWELQYLGLDAIVLQEEHVTTAPTRLGKLPEVVPYATTLAAWILDRHGGERNDHQNIIRRWSRALMLSNGERVALWACLEALRLLVNSWPTVGVAKQKRLASAPHFDQVLLLLQASDRQRFVDVRRRVIELAKTGLAPKPLIDGGDLIALGLKPGPVFSRVLEAVYDAQLEGSVGDKAQALELVKVVASAGSDR